MSSIGSSVRTLLIGAIALAATSALGCGGGSSGDSGSASDASMGDVAVDAGPADVQSESPAYTPSANAVSFCMAYMAACGFSGANHFPSMTTCERVFDQLTAARQNCVNDAVNAAATDISACTDASAMGMCQ